MINPQLFQQVVEENQILRREVERLREELKKATSTTLSVNEDVIDVTAPIPPPSHGCQGCQGC